MYPSFILLLSFLLLHQSISICYQCVVCFNALIVKVLLMKVDDDKDNNGKDELTTPTAAGRQSVF